MRKNNEDVNWALVILMFLLGFLLAPYLELYIDALFNK
jgi:hypothetical protein